MPRKTTAKRYLSILFIASIMLLPTASPVMEKIYRNGGAIEPRAAHGPDITITGRYILNSVLDIGAGEWVRIENATYIINSTYNGEFGINVYNSGKLEIINSTLKRADERASFFFKAETGSNLLISNSLLEKCGYPDGPADEKGLYIATDNAVITDSRFNGSECAISIINSAPTILDSFIENSSTGIYSYGSNAEIRDSRFYNNTFAYMAISSGDRIENSSFEGNFYGIKAQSASIKLRNLSLNRETYGVYFSSSTPVLENTTIDGAAFGIYTYFSTVDMKGIHIAGGSYGLYAYGSTYHITEVESDATYDIYSISSSGTVRNSTLNGSRIALNNAVTALFDSYISPIESIDALRFSTLNLINTTGSTWNSHAPLTVDHTSQINFGNYAGLTVKNSSGAPMPDSTVIALNDGIPVFNGKTGGNGHIPNFPFINWTCEQSGERSTNSTVYARWNTTTENLTGNYTAHLKRGMNSTVYLKNQATSNITWIHDRAIGTENYTHGTLILGTGISSTTSSNLTIRGSTMILVNSLSSRGGLQIDNSSVLCGRADETLSPKKTGIVINSGSTGKIRDSSFRMIQINIYTDECSISNSTFSRTETACYINSASPDLNNIEISRGFTGLNLYEADARIRGLRIDLYETGIREYSGRNRVENAYIKNCTTAVYSIASTSRFERLNTSDVHTAFTLHSSNVMVEKCNLSATIGIECISSSPSISNSSIESEEKIRAVYRSFPAALDTDINASNTVVDSTSFITVGGYSNITVVNETGYPVGGVPVSVFDRFGPSARTTTDKNGIAIVSGRDGVITTSGYERVQQEAISWAEDGSGNIYFAREKYIPYMNLTLLKNSSVIYFPSSHYVPASGESMENTTLILGDNITVPNGRKLSIRSSEVFAGRTQFRIFGSLEIENSHVHSALTEAPGIPHRYFPYFWNSQMSWINSSIFDNPEEIDSYNRNLRIDGLVINGAQMYGLMSQSSDADMKNIHIRWANTGLYLSQGWPNIKNITVENCTTGIQLVGDRGGIEDIRATGCTNALSIQSSEIWVAGADVDANSGLYFYKSRGAVDNSTISGTNYGINIRNSEISLRNSRISSSAKGVISISSTIHASENTFLNNSDTGLYMSESGGRITGNRFEGNEIGLALYQSNPYVNNNSFLDNKAGIRIQSSYPTVDNCTFYRNERGIQTTGAAISLKNSRMENNTIALDMNGNYLGDIIGKKKAFLTFMHAGQKNISIPLPARSTLEDMRVTLTGIELGWVPVRTDAYIQRDADISDGTAVWADYRSGNYDIYMRNMSADENRNSVPDIFEMPFQNRDVQLTAGVNSQGIPSVSGEIIAWKNFTPDGRGQVFLYNTINKTSWSISPIASLSDITISGSIAAWSQESGGNREIFAYSLLNKTTWQVTHTPDNEYHPSVWKDRMVWHSQNISLSSERSNIVFCNLTTGEKYNVTSDSYLEFNPSIWGNYIAWHDNSRGDVTGDGVDDEIVKVINIGPDGIPGTGDDFKVGESQGWESAFNPSLSSQWAVWYYHNRTTDMWGTMAMNLTTGRIERISSDDGGDSQPQISGSEVIRMDKSDSDWDVCLMDLNSRGRPTNVSLDMNDGGYGRRNSSGEFSSITFGYPLIETSEDAGEVGGSVASETAGIVEMNLTVSMKVTSSIYKTEITLPDNASFTAIETRGTTLYMENSSILSNGHWPHNSTAILLDSSTIDSLNCTMGWGNSLSLNDASQITVRNYLNIRVINESGTPIDATLDVRDNGMEAYHMLSGSDGLLKWLTITDRIIYDSGVVENSTQISASAGGLKFPDNPRFINMSLSHTELFKEDKTPPNIWISPVKSIYAGGTDLTVSWEVKDNNTAENSTSIYLEDMEGNNTRLIAENLTANGSYTLQVPSENGYFRIAISSKDSVGNGATNETEPFYIDSTSPEIELISPENESVIRDDNITVRISDRSNITIRYSIDNSTDNSTWIHLANISAAGHNIHTEEANISTETWPEGNITLIIEVEDEAGNTNKSLFIFTLDRTAPEIEAETEGDVIKSGIPVNYSISDSYLSGICVYVNGIEVKNRTLTSTTSLSDNLSTDGWSDGGYSIEFTAEDMAGNRAAAFLNISVDNIPPTFALPEGSIVGRDKNSLPIQISDLHLFRAALITPFYTEQSHLSGITDRIELNVSGWTDGRYGISVKAEDSAGNSLTFIFTLTIDRTSPVISISYPTTMNASQEITIKFNTTDLSGVPRAVLKYRDNTTENWMAVAADVINGSAVIPGLNHSGQIEFYIEATDGAGNTGKTTAYYINITESSNAQGNNSNNNNNTENTENNHINPWPMPPSSLYLTLSLIIIIILLILEEIVRRKKGEEREENTDIEGDYPPPWN